MVEEDFVVSRVITMSPEMDDFIEWGKRNRRFKSRSAAARMGLRRLMKEFGYKKDVKRSGVRGSKPDVKSYPEDSTCQKAILA